MMYILNNICLEKGAFTLRTGYLDLEQGKTYAVVGPNGCGKSTFLDLLAFLHRPVRGELIFGGASADYSNARSLVSLRRRVSYHMQHPWLFDDTVFGNVASGLAVRGIPGSEADRRAEKMMACLNLTELGSSSARSVSGGESQRTALARALVLDAETYLMDEPTAGVDADNIELVEGVIRNLNSGRDRTIIFATHSKAQAARLADHVLTIENGLVRRSALENIFSGVLEKGEDDLMLMDTGGRVRICVNTQAQGRRTISIRPMDIILSQLPFDSSALNHFEGVIRKIEETGAGLHIYVDTGVTFCVAITHKSFHDMGLNIGGRAWVTFKASAVKVF